MKRACLSLLSLVILVTGVALYAQEADAPKLQQVAMLAADASRDETTLTVDVATGITVDRDLVIESRDGKSKETVMAKHVYGNSVILHSKLKNRFLAGAKLYQ